MLCAPFNKAKLPPNPVTVMRESVEKGLSGGLLEGVLGVQFNMARLVVGTPPVNQFPVPVSAIVGTVAVKVFVALPSRVMVTLPADLQTISRRCQTPGTGATLVTK